MPQPMIMRAKALNSKTRQTWQRSKGRPLTRMCLLSLRTWYCLIEGPPAIAKSGSDSCGSNDAPEKMKMVAFNRNADDNLGLWKVRDMEELIAD